MNTAHVIPGVDSRTRVATTLLLASAVNAALGWRFGPGLVLLAYLVFGTVGAIVVVTDLAARKIPARVVLPAYPLAAALLAITSASDHDWWSLGRAGISMAAVGGLYLMLGLAFAGQFGMGDIELGGLLGLYLGWIGWSALATGTLLGWALAALAIPLRRTFIGADETGALPAGPFLVAGALVAILVIR